MKKIKIKNKKSYLVFILCLILLLGIIIYFVINFFRSKDISYNNNVNSKIVLKDEDIYKYDDVKIFKGNNPDNYIYFSNILWRIISINKDGTLDIVTDNNINILKNVNYNVNKYVNDVFLSSIDKEYLDKTSYCDDIITVIEKNNCKDIYTGDYVRLLSIEDIVNSDDNGNSYLLNNIEYWLNNKYKDNPFVIVNNKISNVNNDTASGVRPVVRLNKDIIIDTGNGTYDDPYVVKDNRSGFNVGDYIKLDNDLWTIYEVNKDSIKLALTNSLSGAKVFGDNSEYNISNENSIANYLNNTYLDSLSYKDILIDSKWEIGTYSDNYNDVSKKNITTKVGMLSVKDIKLVNNKWGYYLITPNGNDEVYFYNANSFTSKTNYLHSIVPTISIKNDYNVSGNGTKDNPFKIEV